MTDIVVSHLYKAFDGKQVFSDFSAVFQEKTVTAVMGYSGVGKTTLLRILMGLEAMDSGTVTGIQGARLAVVFQEDRLLESCTAEENIMLSARNNELAYKISDVCGITEFFKLYPSEMSGGMKKRTAIARAIAFDGDMLLIDEPFNGIDEERIDKIIRFLKTYIENKVCIIVTHDINQVKKLNAKIIYI